MRTGVGAAQVAIGGLMQRHRGLRGPYKKLRFDNPSAIPKRNGVYRAH